jgi:hypothetical protein
MWAANRNVSTRAKFSEKSESKKTLAQRLEELLLATATAFDGQVVARVQIPRATLIASAQSLHEHEHERECLVVFVVLAREQTLKSLAEACPTSGRV